MSGKIVTGILMIVIPFVLNGELIKLSKIRVQDVTLIKVNRNIFSPQKMDRVQNKKKVQKELTGNKKDPGKKEKGPEVIASVFYEGFLVKDDLKYALLKLDGKFYISKEGDTLPGNISIKKILVKKVILEIESSEISVLKKGEKNVI